MTSKKYLDKGGLEHTWAKIKALLNGKADKVHSHTKSQITDFPSWIGSTKPSYSWSEISGKPSSFPPSSHTHPISEVVNLQSELNMRVVGPEINLGTVTYNVASSSTYYLNTPPKYYQKTTLSLKVVKDVGGGYYWTSFNIYFPTGGRYKVISISARKVEVDPDAPHSFEISTKVYAGASYSGGALVCSGKAYNKVNQVYGIMDISYEKIL